MNGQPSYGPAQANPPRGATVFYHGTKTDHHGVWEVAGETGGTLSRTVLHRFRLNENGALEAETLTISVENRTITVLGIEEEINKDMAKIEQFLADH